MGVTEQRWGDRRNFTFMPHTFLVVTVKRWLKSVYIYGSYRKIKTGVPLFLDHSVFQKYFTKYFMKYFTPKKSMKFYITSCNSYLYNENYTNENLSTTDIAACNRCCDRKLRNERANRLWGLQNRGQSVAKILLQNMASLTTFCINFSHRNRS